MKKMLENGDKQKKTNAYPAKKRVASKVTFIAKTHGIKIDDAWDRFVMPTVNAEFELCVAAEKARSEG